MMRGHREATNRFEQLEKMITEAQKIADQCVRSASEADQDSFQLSEILITLKGIVPQGSASLTQLFAMDEQYIEWHNANVELLMFSNRVKQSLEHCVVDLESINMSLEHFQNLKNSCQTVHQGILNIAASMKQLRTECLSLGEQFGLRRQSNPAEEDHDDPPCSGFRR